MAQAAANRRYDRIIATTWSGRSVASSQMKGTTRQPLSPNVIEGGLESALVDERRDVEQGAGRGRARDRSVGIDVGHEKVATAMHDGERARRMPTARHGHLDRSRADQV
jgi:hypothetical protein